MPFDDPDMQMHRALLQHARQKRIDERRAKKKADKVRRRVRLGNLKTSELRSEIARRNYRKRMQGMTVEQREEAAKRRVAFRALARARCTHAKLPPKKKKDGTYFCPSCKKPVPAPRPGEDLVI